MKKTKKDLLTELIEAAKRHGEDSDPDHEVGDLQEMLRTAFDMLTPEHQQELYEEYKNSFV